MVGANPNVGQRRRMPTRGGLKDQLRRLSDEGRVGDIVTLETMDAQQVRKLCRELFWPKTYAVQVNDCDIIVTKIAEE